MIFPNLIVRYRLLPPPQHPPESLSLCVDDVSCFVSSFRFSFLCGLKSTRFFICVFRLSLRNKFSCSMPELKATGRSFPNLVLLANIRHSQDKCYGYQITILSYAFFYFAGFVRVFINSISLSSDIHSSPVNIIIGSCHFSSFSQSSLICSLLIVIFLLHFTYPSRIAYLINFILLSRRFNTGGFTHNDLIYLQYCNCSINGKLQCR